MKNPGQNTKDVPETITQEHAVKEQEGGESETLLEEKGEQNTAMGGAHENRDLENKEDRRIQPYGDERRRKSNDVRQGAQLLTPVEIAKNIVERDYISKTLRWEKLSTLHHLS